MQTIIKHIESLKESLISIREIFNQNQGLEQIIISHYTEEDGGDVNTYGDTLTINGHEFDLEDDDLDNWGDIENPLLSSDDLNKLEHNFFALLMGEMDGDEGTTTFNRDEILNLIL